MNTPEELALFCEKHLDLEDAKLDEEYYYQSLPLCVIDAVYSIGVRYSSTRKVVIRFCEKYNLKRIRSSKDVLPKFFEQFSTTSFLEELSKYSYEELAESIFKNKQRTSTRNGVLKSEAVIRFAEILQKFGGEYFQNRDNFIGKNEFEREIRKLPGQKSGISVRYFYMLAGSNDFIKPDRMINRFIEERTGKKLSISESQELIEKTQKILSKEYDNLTPRLLDNLIWNFQRNRN